MATKRKKAYFVAALLIIALLGLHGYNLSLKTAQTDERDESILQDMYRCSVSVGVSADTLKRNRKHMKVIANQAAIFLDSFWEVVPKKLGEKSCPCWYSNLTIDESSMIKNSPSKSNVKTLYQKIFRKPAKPRLLCLPSFLIAGFPKGGTTSLHYMLSHHPQVRAPENKEPQWWARGPFGKLTPGENKYRKLMTVKYLMEFIPATNTNESSDVITYDGSQTTLIDSNFNIEDQDYCAMASVVHQVLPNAKMLVIMRDPVSRMYSHYHSEHKSRKSWSDEMRANASLHFHKNVKVAIKEFEHCRKEHSLFECANQKTNRKELATWLGVGIYYIHLLKWLQFWPRENFLFMDSTRLATEPYTLFTNITDFLSLKTIPRQQAKTWLYRKNKGYFSDEMFPETKRLLQNFYAPYNKELEKLIGLNWNYSL